MNLMKSFKNIESSDSSADDRIHQALSLENLALLLAVSREGSLAAAARFMKMVPSALTYRVRQIEESLDVLLIDRTGRKATLTDAGQALVGEGQRLLSEAGAIAQRVKRIASGWEPTLTIAVDSIVSESVVLELCDEFYNPFGTSATCPTQIRLRNETLSGTWEALLSGEVDLSLGVVVSETQGLGIQSAPLGEVPFVFAVAPNHPLAAVETTLRDAQIQHHRAVAVADSARRIERVTVGLLAGQDVLTVGSMRAKLEAQLRGLGCGFLPEAIVKPYAETGRLVIKPTQRRPRVSRVSYAWRSGLGLGNGTRAEEPGLAMSWWLEKLSRARTRKALLSGARLNF
jgi:DNA-binding transcriptional LysR family regulator